MKIFALVLVLLCLLLGCFKWSFFVMGKTVARYCPPCVCIPGVAIKPIAFWYRDNALYWAVNGEYKPSNYIEFQLDKNMSPTINYDPIKKIEVLDNKVFVFTKDKYWILHFSGDPTWDWYVENYRVLK